MPWTADRFAGHQAFRERAVVVGACSANREEFVSAAGEKHAFFANMPRQHLAVGESVARDTLRQVWSFAHVELRLIGRLTTHGRPPLVEGATPQTLVMDDTHPAPATVSKHMS